MIARPAAHLAANLAAYHLVVDQFAIAMGQEDNFLDAKHFGGGALFDLPQRNQLLVASDRSGRASLCGRSYNLRSTAAFVGNAFRICTARHRTRRICLQ